MIQVIPIKHNISGNSNIRTHILTPSPWITITLTIDSKKENILSIIEDHLLETISWIEWNPTDIDKDFRFLTENYNKFIKNLDSSDIEDISVIISVLRSNILTISAVWRATAYLVEWDEISEITAQEKWRTDFHTLTEWEVSRNSSIYISNTDVLNTIGSELLYEFSNLSSQEYTEEALSVFRREIETSLHIIRISYSFKNTIKEVRNRGRGQIDLLKNKWVETAKMIKNLPIWWKIKNEIDKIDFQKNTKQKYLYLTVWIIVIFLLLTIIIQWITWLINSNNSNWEVKNQIKEAQTLIEESSKLSWNAEIFEKNISQAEKILFELRNEVKYQSDIQTLQSRIDALKKEMYDIQTVNLSEKNSIIPINENFIPKFSFEHNNKIIVIGNNWIINDYVRWTDNPKIIPYPNNDTIENATITTSGIPYITTTTGKIITKQQNNLKYTLLNGQDNWDSSNKIKSYNWNIYILNPDWNQIYRYKASSNGFSTKINVLPSVSSVKILDIWIDWWFYILTSDGKIWRYVSTKSEEWIKHLTLNSIPWQWNIDPNKSTEFIVKENLSYVYIKNDKKIWIFQPNSKSFQDINALTYIGLITINSEDEITGITVPRDWLLYITTSKWIFEQNFSITDWKMILN